MAQFGGRPTTRVDRLSRRRLVQRLLAVSSVALLAACGGASGSTGSTATSAAVTAPTVASTTAAATGSVVTTSFGGSTSLAATSPAGAGSSAASSTPASSAATQQFASANETPTNLDAFSSGQVAMFDNGVWAVKTYDLVKSLSWDVAPFPILPNGKHVNASGCPYLAITQGSKHHDQAWSLVDFLESPDPLRQFNTADTTLPPRKSVATSSAFLSTNPHLQYFVNELAGTHFFLYIPGSVDIFKVHNQMYSDAISGKVSPADAIAASVPLVQAILDKNAAVL